MSRSWVLYQESAGIARGSAAPAFCVHREQAKYKGFAFGNGFPDPISFDSAKRNGVGPPKKSAHWPFGASHSSTGAQSQDTRSAAFRSPLPCPGLQCGWSAGQRLAGGRREAGTRPCPSLVSFDCTQEEVYDAGSTGMVTFPTRIALTLSQSIGRLLTKYMSASSASELCIELAVP